MGDKTTIEWTDATWNPVTGCSKVSQGCKNCYAERVFPRAYGNTFTGGPTVPTVRPRKFTDVQCHPDRLDQPLRWKRPRRIFVNSMSDLFHEAVPTNFIDQVFDRMIRVPRHTFQILTKRPERMRDYCDSVNADRWKHIHLGVSVEDQQTADERIPLLLQTPAAVRFISYEPALGPVDLKLWNPREPKSQGEWMAAVESTPTSKIGVTGKIRSDDLHWVICGGESGPNARPMHPDWARSMRDQCQAAGVPFFFKQWGEWAPIRQPAKNSYRWPILQGEPDGGVWSYLVGKKAAGATLDGREWKEFPR